MPILTVVNLPGDSRLRVNQDCTQTLTDILEVWDVEVRTDPQGNAWLFVESSDPLDPPQLIHNLAEWGINPTIRASVTYDQSGSRKTAREWYTNDGRGRMPEIIKEEVRFPGAQTFFGRPSHATKAAGRGGDGQYNLNLELEPILYHKLNVAALEGGWGSVEEFALQILEDNAHY